MNFKKNIQIHLLLIIIILGLLVRVVYLSKIPYGFFADEASIGYNAYTILTKGEDEYGTPFPLFFRAFDEYKSPVQIYSTVPFIALFGLSEFAARLTSVFYGTIGVLAIFLFTKELFRNTKSSIFIAFFAALFLAISPWHIHISRIAFEQMPYVSFALFGLFFFMKSIQNNKFFPLSVIFFVLSFYSYFPARIFIPLFVFGLSLCFFKKLFQKKIYFFLGIIIGILLLIPYITTLPTTGFSRWQQVSIFSNPPEGETVERHIFNNYLSHFSFDFLFLKGDIDMPGQFITRHSVRGIGELYIFQFPLIFLGLFFLIQKKHYKILLIFIIWLILYPLGSMFTLDKNVQATRSIIGVIPFQILSAYGLIVLFQTLSQRFKKPAALFCSTLVVIIILASFSQFLYLYFVKYPLYSSDFWGWQYGAKDIIKYYALNKSQYDELVMAPEFNAPDIFFKFYLPNGCNKCKIGLPDNSYNSNLKQLFAVTPQYVKNNTTIRYAVKEQIYYPSNEVAFLLIELVQYDP